MNKDAIFPSRFPHHCYRIKSLQNAAPSPSELLLALSKKTGGTPVIDLQWVDNELKPYFLSLDGTIITPDWTFSSFLDLFSLHHPGEPMPVLVSLEKTDRAGVKKLADSVANREVPLIIAQSKKSNMEILYRAKPDLPRVITLGTFLWYLFLYRAGIGLGKKKNSGEILVIPPWLSGPRILSVPFIKALIRKGLHVIAPPPQKESIRNELASLPGVSLIETVTCEGKLLPEDSRRL